MLGLALTELILDSEDQMEVFLTLLERKTERGASVSAAAPRWTMMGPSPTFKVQKPPPLLEVVVAAPLASCWLRLYCQAHAEFIALFFLLRLITIMGKLGRDKWINLEKMQPFTSLVLKSNNTLAF